MNGYNPRPEGVDGAAVWLSLAGGASTFAVAAGILRLLDVAWLWTVPAAWLVAAVAAAATWWAAHPKEHAGDDRPGLEDGGVLAELGGVVHHERAVTQHTRRLR